MSSESQEGSLGANTSSEDELKDHLIFYLSIIKEIQIQPKSFSVQLAWLDFNS
jgi:hypothetical protein